MTENPKANDIPLIPFSDFKETAKEILNVSKQKSDEQIATLQAANVSQRTEAGQQKRGKKPKS